MNKNFKFHRLAVGGPFNGQLMHCSGDLIEYPNNVTYRAVPIRLGEDYGTVYVFRELTNERALEMLQEMYLAI